MCVCVSVLCVGVCFHTSFHVLCFICVCVWFACICVYITLTCVICFAMCRVILLVDIQECGGNSAGLADVSALAL